MPRLQYLQSVQSWQNLQSTLVKMPKGSKQQLAKLKHKKQVVGGCSSAQDKPLTKKRHPIKKEKHCAGVRNEENDEELLNSFMELVECVNRQFTNASHLFSKQPTRSSVVPLFSLKPAFEVTILPTIKECSHTAEQQEDRIKKEKEQTQISSAGQKVW